LFVIGAMAFLTWEGASTGSPYAVEMPTPQRIVRAGGKELAEFEAGRKVVAQSGCLACHKLGENGNNGPGPELTEIGARIPRLGIARTLVNPTAPMPSFRYLPPHKFAALVDFLSQLNGKN
ncbi:MAG TPA: c-type cytochrome, partial [Solirubrobacteraceae bacterium]|nr:c-type cytochrome [Solirubrobacteraceae bacterium]